MRVLMVTTGEWKWIVDSSEVKVKDVSYHSNYSDVIEYCDMSVVNPLLQLTNSERDGVKDKGIFRKQQIKINRKVFQQ